MSVCVFSVSECRGGGGGGRGLEWDMDRKSVMLVTGTDTGRLSS